MSGGRNNSGAAALFAAALPFSIACAALAADDVPPQAAACIACHGPGGNPTDPSIPSLAGQPAQFISTQLYLYREGNRKDPQMAPLAANLTNAEMNALAAYFSRQKPAPPARKTAPVNASAGPRLAERYHCIQCHGPALAGQQHIPRLAGQQFDYLKAQLQRYKARTRADFDGTMTSAAEPLSDRDIEILADYLAGLE